MDRITGVVQHYDWGDLNAIPSLLGASPDGRPWAELWLGTHAGGAATTSADDHPLAETSGELPYLLKVLAAAEPLSLQTHPTSEQAAAGFARENAAGIALDAGERIYRDAAAKPELLCALTPFEALCGFRPFDQSIAWFETEGWTELADQLRAGPANYLRWALASGAHRLPDGAPGWVQRVAGRYPGDGGVLVALILNRLILQPGEAIFLDAGNLHAYLLGTAIEVMASSDNVVRGGLTSKHVDIDELLAIVDLTPLPDPVVRPMEVTAGRWRYDTPNTPFRLWRWELEVPVAHVATGRELLLCTEGDAGALRRGDAAYLAPGELIDLGGPATIFRVEER
ncbi:MAG: mannose-6-phosphate isomerase, class I [Ilumatobacteraceae bacterium]